jgi:UDP-GlcNAc3NAcA epimerase
MKFLNVIGARPQIIKASAISRAVRNSSEPIEEVVIHTGQHYDPNMSDVFIQELGVTAPKYNLEVGSASHAKQTAAMINGFEQVIEAEKPDWVVVYGDTNSTLAAAVTASKMNIRIAHIEAGLRSFNKTMPEEINRIVCDHLSTLLFSPTQAGVKNLIKEGFSLNNQSPFSFDHAGVFHCGDLMLDNSLYFSTLADEKSAILNNYGLEKGNFILATIHRNHNTDDLVRINNIVSAFIDLTEQTQMPLIWPVHPRTAKMLPQLLKPEIHQKLMSSKLVILADPASFFDMILLEKHALLVVTDSGGVQKEAYFFQKPCVIVRPETEWVELVENGCATLADANYQAIIDQSINFMKAKELVFKPIFGDGKAAEFILKTILSEPI